MGVYKFLQQVWKTPRKDRLYKDRLIEWRKEESTVKLERPTRLDRARNLGYKAKEGIIVVRQRIVRGGKNKPDFGRRRTKRSGRTLQLSKNYQQIAEERAAKKHTNMEVLNSYFVAQDGKHAWYEVILVDWSHPVIKNDDKLNFLANQKGRAFRGVTSIGKRSRGLLNKGKGAEKLRPSRSAVVRRKLATQRK